MDIQTAMDGVPTGANWWPLNPAEKHKWLSTVLGKTLHQINSEEREPDSWESHCLVGAIGYGCVGFYGAGVTMVEKAFTPSSERAAEPDGPTVTLRALEAGFDDFKSRPAVGTEKRPSAH